ncbi:MAG: 50S ribosomal protein L1 [Chloroflexota bacterium]|nr:50S ribosomal protein L1 [Chloroflexota bacterium]
MARHGKRYAESLAQVDRLRDYEPREAFELIKELPSANFDETVEVHVRLGVDPRRAEQQVRETVSLPEGTGTTVRIMVFAEGEAAREAEEAGADYVGVDEYVERIEDGWVDFDVAVAIPQAMSKIGRLGRILGPRGLMPSPRSGTMVQPDDIAETIEALRKGRVEFRVDRTGNVHIPIGKVSFTVDALMNNFIAVMSAIWQARPAAVSGGAYIRRLTFATTMGPGVRVDVSAARDLV